MMMSVAPAYAQGVDAPFISFGRAVEAPRGMMEMCAAERSDFCGRMDDTAAPTTIMVGAQGDYATSALAGDAGSTAYRPVSLCDIAAAVLPTVQSADTVQTELSWAAPMRFDALSLFDPFHARPSIARAIAVTPAQPSVCGTGIAQALVAPVADLPSLMADAATPSPAEVAVATLKPAVLMQVEPAPLAAIDGKDAMKTLKTVNRFVNSRVVQRTDWESYNRGEVWRRSGVGKGAQGDCEDIAIEKRFQLVGRGFPPDRLSFAVVYLPQVGLHTVLIVRLPDGDYVLDSRTPFIERWNRTGYSWLSLQNFQAPEQWRAPASAGHYASTPSMASPAA